MRRKIVDLDEIQKQLQVEKEKISKLLEKDGYEVRYDSIVRMPGEEGFPPYYFFKIVKKVEE